MINEKGEMDDKWPSVLSPFKALFNYAKKEEIAHRKLQKTRRAYVQERIMFREELNSEIAGLNKLLKEKSIDEDTHARLNKMLEIGYEQKRRERRKKYGFIKTHPAMPVRARYVIVRGRPQLRWRDLLTGRFVKQVHSV